MKNYLYIIILSFLAALNVSHASTIIWTNTAGGGWNEAVNWSPNVVPGSGDTVLVTNDATFTVNVDGIGNAGSLVLGTSDLNSTNIATFQVNSGNTFILNGTVTVTTNGQFNLNHDSIMIGTNAVLFGTINGNGPTLSGTLTVASNSVLNVNPPGMTFNGYFAGIGVVYNYGTVNWNTASAYTDNYGVIYNYGLWQATTDGIFYGQSSSGYGTFDNYGIFAKTGGTNTTYFDGNISFNNYGEVEVQTGMFNTQKGTNNGTFATAAGTFMEFGNTVILSGTNTFTGAGILTNSPILGTNAVIEGTLTCDGGIITIGGSLTIDSSAQLNLLSSVTFDGVIDGTSIPALFTNNGTVNWSAGALFGDNSPVIDNNGLWVAASDNLFTGRINAGATTFNNTGIFEKSGTTGTTTLDANTIFNNLGGTNETTMGTVSIQSGNGGGTFQTQGGATLLLGTFDFAGNTTFTGLGPVVGLFEATNATFYGTLNLSNVNIHGTFTLATGSILNFNAGPQDIDFNGNFNGNPTTVTNNGTVNWISGNFFGDNSPTIVNNGTWNLETNGTFQGESSSGDTTFDNLGTVRKTVMGGVTSFTACNFNNTGLLDVQTGTVSLASSFALGGGTLNFGLNNPTNFGSVAFSGSVQLNGTVSANLNNLFGPDTTNSFPVVTYTSESGVFTNFNLPSGFAWTNHYGGNTFSLQIASVNPPQTVAIPSVQNGVFSFSFNAVLGQTYQVETNSNLATTNWGNDGAPIYVTNNPIVISNLVNIDPQLFYRLVLQ